MRERGPTRRILTAGRPRPAYDGRRSRFIGRSTASLVRCRLWKVELQKWADETGLIVEVCHYPPGTSKWNKIEHRVFCHITRNWWGTPLETLEVVVDSIGATTTVNGTMRSIRSGAENDMVVLVGLRHGTCQAALGADDDLRHLAKRLRAAWPDVRLHVRGDSGLGVPRMDDVGRELRLTYTFGIGMNSRLRDLSEDLVQAAVERYERTGEPQRSFLLVDHQAES